MDKTTKILLALAVAGLWANAISGTMRSASAGAIDDLAYEIRQIRNATEAIASGGLGCSNSKICD